MPCGIRVPLHSNQDSFVYIVNILCFNGIILGHIYAHFPKETQFLMRFQITQHDTNHTLWILPSRKECTKHANRRFGIISRQKFYNKKYYIMGYRQCKLTNGRLECQSYVIEMSYH